MKSKKNFLSVLLVAVLLCTAVFTVLMLSAGATVTEPDPNTTVYLVRSADGKDDGSVSDDGLLVFKTIRGATAYADKQNWNENAKLRIEIDQESLSMTKTKNYLFVSYDVKTILRQDSSSLPITITSRGEEKTKITVNKVTSDEKVGNLLFCNDYTIENIELETTTAATIYVTNRTEFKNCIVKMASSGAIAGSGNSLDSYGLNDEDILKKRLDENNEITATVIFSGDTKVTTNYVYGTIAYSGEAKTGTDTDLGKFLEVGTQKVYYSDINGHVIFQDNAVLNGAVRGIRNSTFLGDGKVTLKDNAKITGNVQGTFNRNVKGNTSSIFEMTGGTVEGSIIAFPSSQISIGVTSGNKMQFIISGGTVKGSVSFKKTASTVGEFGVVISGGTFEKAVNGDNISLADGANVSIRGNGTLAVSKVGSNVTITKEGAWGKFDTVYVSAPANADITMKLGEGAGEVYYLNKEGYEVRGAYLVPEVSLMLNERVELKALINKELADFFVAEMGTPTLAFKLDGKDLGKGFNDLVAEGENYTLTLPAAGAGAFDLPLEYVFNGNAVVTTTIQALAEKGVTLYADVPAGAIFKALVDYGKAANGETELKYFDAATLEAFVLPETVAPVAGTGNVKINSVTLLMGDAIGIRFKTESDLADVSVKVNGETLGADFYSAKDGAIDIYVNANNLNEILTIEILDANGTLCATFGYAASNIAADIYTKDATNLKAASILELVLAIEASKTVA